MKLTTLGLDLQANCGHALLCMAPGRGTVALTGRWDCSTADGIAVDLDLFECHLRHGLSFDVDKVFYVQTRKRRSRWSDRYVALRGRMLQTCADVGVACEALSSGEVKTFATGNHRAGKEDLRRAADIFGYDEFEFDDNSAFVVARCGMECFDDA